MKKLLRSFLAVLLIAVIGCSSAMACGLDDWNDNWRQEIEEARHASQVQILCRMVDSANRSVERLVRIAQATPYDDVDWLLASVDAIVAPVFAYGDYIGVKVECTYVTYYIDGRYVDVDPLKVINILP